ncbi:MAG: hypothetical protein JW910_06405, partial [Anaerolineae bacterium]|nr:hypothetical protein [Anaerolineae bacterium]
MHKRLLGLCGLLIVVVLALTACGGGETPTPTPEPTDTPTETPIPEPTATPAPTIDPASLPVEALQSTLEALQTDLSYAQAREQGASSAGEEGAALQDIR